ncbi:hypothetical protein ACOSP7_014343 [Xanthoceras sorbifolium]
MVERVIVLFKRLDRGISNLEWMELFPGSSVSHLNFWKSDYRPILIEVEAAIAATVSLGTAAHRHFQFDECWAHEHGCAEIVKQVWQASFSRDAIFSVKQKIAICSANLQRWYKKSFNLLQHQIRNKRQQLQMLNDIQSDSDW